MEKLEGLEIYVKSSALGESGIHWRKVSDPQQCEEIPDILRKRIIPKKTGGLGTINYLVNETKLSCVLVRYDEKLLLEVTGIESPERSDRLGRKVLNSVVWIVDNNPEKEPILRKLTARALMSFWGKYPDFINTISSAVKFDGLEGFKAGFDILKELAANGDEKLKLLGLEIEESESDNQEAIWEAQQRPINSDAQIESLAKQLATSPLPEGKDLVVIAEMLPEGGILYKGIVWPEPESNEVLTLSSIFKSEDVPSLELSQSSPSGSRTESPQPPKKKKLILLGLASVLIVTMSSVVWVLSQRQETPQKIPIPQILISPQPETQPSPPTQPNRQTKPQLPPHQQSQKTP
ncbi:MAG: hypothetical protein AB1589_19585 [Cyanobacteriota bacterium]